MVDDELKLVANRLAVIINLYFFFSLLVFKKDDYFNIYIKIYVISISI